LSSGAVNGSIVALDPIDGSLNAKRMLVHLAVSIGVALGPTINDVVLGHAFDLGTQEEYVGIAGQGAWLDGERTAARSAERRTRDGRLELLAVETNDAQGAGRPFWFTSRRGVEGSRVWINCCSRTSSLRLFGPPSITVGILSASSVGLSRLAALSLQGAPDV
jgi:fructose-1,6-bisphosphatase/inositol monophosphatase family enzyme